MGRLQQDQFKDEARKRSQTRRRKAAEPTAPVGARRNDLLPKLQLEMRPVTDLTEAQPRRIRRSDEAQVARVREAIGQLGFCSPVAITRDGEILDGHSRWEAAQQLGLREIPCLVIDHLSAAEQRSLRLALNRLPERGVWDFDALKIELEELIDLDAPIEAIGFDPAELDIILLDEDLGNIEAGPLEPDTDHEPTCEPGQLWALGPHRLLIGDARDPAAYAGLFDEGEAAQLVLTDPPFNVPVGGHVTSGDHREFAMASGEMSREEFFAFNGDWMRPSLERLRDGGLMGAFIDWRSVDIMIGAGLAQQLSHQSGGLGEAESGHGLVVALAA